MELAFVTLLTLAIASLVASAVALATDAPATAPTARKPFARVFRAVDAHGRVLGVLTVGPSLDVGELAAWRLAMAEKGSVHVIIPN